MPETVLITGSTDGIGLATARALVAQGHHVLIHGRKETKLEQVKNELSTSSGSGRVESYLADFTDLSAVANLAESVRQRHDKLDVLINNAGVYKTPQTITKSGIDARFVVNTIASYLLTRKLLPLMDSSSRVINLSSAAQSSVDLQALAGRIKISNDFDAYAQSKLAITMWSRAMAVSLQNNGPVVIAVNPGSLLATKMVKEGFGVAGHDITIGSQILTRLSLEDEFATASGKYFDNDKQQFSSPHPDALNHQKSHEVVEAIESILSNYQ